ncbi:MAG: hypothetical protein K8T25_15155 [Planctomycetia bacterium]|nr:hypothetical protein [Planctomycetia bacterium]
MAGMVTRLSKDQPLLVLDFENPEEVIRRQATAQEELTKRKGSVTPPTSTQVTAPAGGPQASNSPPAAAPPQNDRYAAPPAVGNPMTGNPVDPAIPNPVRQARNPSDDPAFLPR